MKRNRFCQPMSGRYDNPNIRTRFLVPIDFSKIPTQLCSNRTATNIILPNTVYYGYVYFYDTAQRSPSKSL
jgi:hypothetical protein